jgi:hypothetical protein
MRRLILAALVAAQSLVAQEQPRAVRYRDPAAFAIEAAAGSVGSLIGIAAVGLSHKCGVEDLACLIMKAGASGATGAIGASLASYAAAGYTGSQRSLGGAALGAVVGTGVGLGVHWLLNHASDRNFDDPYAVVPIFTLSQGIVSAIGSRLLGRR